MAELKSTLELVMERTKNMVGTPEERARKQAEERAARAKGILLRLCEEQVRPEELPRALQDASDSDLEALKAELLSSMINELSLPPNCGDLLDGFRVLVGPSSSTAIGRVAGLTSAYEEARTSLALEAGEKAMTGLAARGISGSAVRPKFETESSYLTGMEDLDRDYQGRLDLLKEEMRRLF